MADKLLLAADSSGSATTVWHHLDPHMLTVVIFNQPEHVHLHAMSLRAMRCRVMKDGTVWFYLKKLNSLFFYLNSYLFKAGTQLHAERTSRNVKFQVLLREL